MHFIVTCFSTLMFYHATIEALELKKTELICKLQVEYKLFA